MKYKQILTLSFIIISGLFLLGCSGKNTADSVAEDAYSFGIYSAAAVPAIALSPFIYSMTHKSKSYSYYKGKTKEQMVDMVGKPIAKYQCELKLIQENKEVWEYKENQLSGNGRFIEFCSNLQSDSNLRNIQSNYIPDLDRCTLVEGVPSKKTKEEWKIQTFECDRNFMKQFYLPGSKKDFFLIDMKTNHGAFTITQPKYRGLYSDPRYVISYEGKEIYKWPKVHHKVKKTTKISETIKFGPGKSTKIKIRVLRKPSIYNEMKISCPK